MGKSKRKTGLQPLSVTFRSFHLCESLILLSNMYKYAINAQKFFQIVLTRQKKHGVDAKGHVKKGPMSIQNSCRNCIVEKK